MWVASEEKAERRPGPFPGVLHTDPRRGYDLLGRASPLPELFDEQFPGINQAASIQVEVDCEGRAQFAGARAECFGRHGFAAMELHRGQPLRRLEGPDQDC